MSFFDDDEPPTRSSGSTRPTRPRRRVSGGGPTRPATAAASGRGGRGPGDQQLLIRRAVALGLAALVLVLIIVGINSCRSSAKKDSLRDYNREVASLVQDSDEQVGNRFFELFSGDEANRSPVTLETQINQLRVLAEDQADRAESLDVPDGMVDAHRNLLLTLDFRAEGLGAIADKIRTALGSDAGAAERATNEIAGQMQKFLASDVIYSQRVAPLIKQTLDDNGITGQSIATSRFLPDLGWLNPATVAERIGGRVGASQRGPLAPGPHGHGLLSVAVGSTVLQPSPAANRIPATSGLAFTVKFQNQGQSDEQDVDVSVRITGAGRPINVVKTVPQTKAGQEQTVEIPLGTAPPIGTPVTIRVTVAPVPGEQTTDNNTQTYTAIFTR